MLALFRSNQASAGILLLLYALLLQAAAWWWGGDSPDNAEGGALAHWLLGKLPPAGWWTWVLPVLLVTAQGIMANVLVTRHRMSRTVTQFPGLFLVVCWSLVPAFRSLHPAQFAGFFLLLALLSLGRTYKNNEPAVALFNVGCWLGMAGLFYPPALYLLPAFVIGVGTLRKFSLRALFQVLTGVGLIFFLAFTWAYFTGQLASGVAWQFGSYGLAGLPGLTAINYAGAVALVLLLLGTPFYYGPVTQLLNIEGKKNMSVLLWLLFFAVLAYWFSGEAGLAYFQLLAIPVGIVLGLRLVQIGRGAAEFYHLVLLTVATVPLLWYALS